MRLGSDGSFPKIARQGEMEPVVFLKPRPNIVLVEAEVARPPAVLILKIGVPLSGSGYPLIRSAPDPEGITAHSRSVEDLRDDTTGSLF